MRLIWREEKRAPSPTFPKIKGYGDALMAAHRRGNPECSLRWCARSRRWDRGPRCPSAVTSGCGRERRGALRVSEPALGGRRRSGSPNTTPRPEEGKAQPRVARTLKRMTGKHEDRKTRSVHQPRCFALSHPLYLSARKSRAAQRSPAPLTPLPAPKHAQQTLPFLFLARSSGSPSPENTRAGKGNVARPTTTSFEKKSDVHV
ncbi:uncharacterized protein LOC419389 isoform X2 [Gallus gallus]|uniref:uncharacterized protein LOC419389 isoform X2 n=1 Tax=Gallus gallus TaxID=9031 RepID=UPI001F00F8B5|nr:uncharacterized protein LOC419389 isoform X2 [Gallus gallus]